MIAYFNLRAMVLVAFCIFWVADAAAQDLTPRLYWPTPKGTQVLVAGYSHASGDVLFDQTIPLYEVDSDIHVGVLAYMHTVSLFGRSSNFMVELPFSGAEQRVS